MQFIPFMIIALALIWLWQKAAWLVVLALLALVGLALYIMKTSSDDLRIAHEKEKEDERLAQKKRENLTTLFREKLEFHAETLVKKFRQTKYKDDYGVTVYDKWFTERNYFIEKILISECPGICEVIDRQWIEKTIDLKIAELFDHSQELQSISINNMSPLEFEHYCASLLTNAGWDARVTQSSGDQGIDILGKFRGLSAVFQCKKYSQPVGNAAVQEIIAGRAFERADIAVVVTNVSFTQSARQLASSADVHLLHFSDLPKFAEILELA